MQIDGPDAVHPSNAEQAASWDGPGGEFWAAHAERFDRAVADHQTTFEEAAAVRPGDRVLDVGCGGGLTTCRAASVSGAGEVLGVDLSGPLLEVARRRASDADLATVAFLQADAQVHPFPREHYDVVTSRCGSMFFGDPVTAFRNLLDATQPGGRLVLLVWQGPERNEWISGTAGVLGVTEGLAPDLDAPGMFSLAQPGRVRDVLGEAGWTDISLDGVEAREWLGTDVDEALAFVSDLFAWLLDGLTPQERPDALARLRGSLAAHAGPDGVTFGSAAWIVTAHRSKSH